MKIVVNARFLTQPLSGVQRYAIECSRQIKKIYPETIFLCPENILFNDIAEELDVQIIGRNKGHLWEQFDLPMYLAKQKYPPLLNLANTAPLLYSNNFITIHDLAFYHHPEWNSKLFSMWYNILIPRLAKRCRHIFTVSQTMRGEIIKYYNVSPVKISVTYNGISQSMLDRKLINQVKKEKIILSVGSFNIRKNHQNLVSAFIHSEINDEYQLVIIGDKNKVFRESNLDESTLTDNNIKIYQGFSEQELINMYQKAEIVASLSVYEGFGIPLLEGLFYGCKIICSDIPVYRELYDKYACFCNPTDIKSVSETLNSTAGNDLKLPDLEPLLEKYNYAASAQTIIERINREPG